MSKRKTMGDQVAEQAVEIKNLQEQLSQCKADFQVLEAAHERLDEAYAQVRDESDSYHKQLQDSKEKLRVVMEELDKVKKELETQKGSYKYQSDRTERAEAEIEQAHATLDTIPEAIPKEFEKDYGKGKHSLSARFMGTLVAVVRAGK